MFFLEMEALACNLFSPLQQPQRLFQTQNAQNRGIHLRLVNHAVPHSLNHGRHLHFKFRAAQKVIACQHSLHGGISRGP